MGLSLPQAIGFALAAGFSGEPLVTMVSISLCECGSQACGCNPDAQGQSCGVLQVYQPAHPGTAQCAVDSACAYRLGWQISSGGTNFHPWSTYNDGCYLTHTATVRAAYQAIQQGPPPPPEPPPTPPPPQPVCPDGWELSNDGLTCLYPVGALGSSGGSVLPSLVLLAGGVGAFAWARRRRGEPILPAAPHGSRGDKTVTAFG